MSYESTREERSPGERSPALRRGERRVEGEREEGVDSGVAQEAGSRPSREQADMEWEEEEEETPSEGEGSGSGEEEDGESSLGSSSDRSSPDDGEVFVLASYPYQSPPQSSVSMSWC